MDIKNSIIFSLQYLSWKSIGAFFYACLIEARNHRMDDFKVFSAAVPFLSSLAPDHYFILSQHHKFIICAKGIEVDLEIDWEMITLR